MRRLLPLILVAGAIAAVPASANASITLNGSFSSVITKKSSTCPSGVADACGTMQLRDLGAADWAYAYGPLFDADGRCFNVDGTLTLVLRSDGSTVSGPLTGRFCPRASVSGQQHESPASYGNPFVETDTVLFGGGTERFAGLSGTAIFRTAFAGARLTGTLVGTLS